VFDGNERIELLPTQRNGYYQKNPKYFNLFLKKPQMQICTIWLSLWFNRAF
jgi:hypothetical protein